MDLDVKLAVKDLVHGRLRNLNHGWKADPTELPSARLAVGRGPLGCPEHALVVIHIILAKVRILHQERRFVVGDVLDQLIRCALQGADGLRASRRVQLLSGRQTRATIFVSQVQLSVEEL